MKLVKKKLSEIKPYWRNPRNNAESVQLVKASIKKYGYNQPIAVDQKFVIVAGHTRYKALKELGVNTVEVVILEHLSEKELKAYRIADNKSGERSFWDMKSLIPELRELDLNEMQPFFYEDLAKLIATASGDLIKDVEQADFQQIALDHSTGQERLTRGREDGKVEFPCPHCGKDIIMNKSDLP